jgi:hypothetical protein
MGDYHGIITKKCSPGTFPDLEIQDLLEEIANQTESEGGSLDLFLERPIPFKLRRERLESSSQGYINKIQQKFDGCWDREASCRFKNTRFHSADIRVSSIGSLASIQFFYTPTQENLINAILATVEGGVFSMIDEEDVLMNMFGESEGIDPQDGEESDTYFRRVALQYLSNLQRLPDIITTRVVKQFDKLRAENFTGDQYSYLLSIRDDILDGFNVDSSLYKLSLARPELVSGLVYLMDSIIDTDAVIEYDLAAMIGPFVKQIPYHISRMMDYYLLARMFGKGYGRNAIIYAGDNHASFLINFLKEHGFEVDYTSGPPRYNPPRQCAIYHSKTILSKRDREEDREEPPSGKRTKK